MNRSCSGQALVEWAILTPLYVGLISAVVAFGQWFVVRHELIAAVRLGAFLYSSGRLTADETIALIQRNLRKGYPALDISRTDIFVGRADTPQAALFRLDKIRIVFHPNPLMQRWKFPDMEEICVIKHAPSYWQTEIPGVNLGPPISW